MILGCMSLLPASLYFFCMPETLSAAESQKATNNSSGMGGIAEDEEGDATTPFGRLT